MKLQNESSPDASANQYPENFSINQYNKSIHYLKQYTTDLTFENIETTLICCLIFICLETIRGNVKATRVHLTRGFEIIDKLVSNSFFLFCSVPEDDQRVQDLQNNACRQGFNPSRLSKIEWYSILRFFIELELGATLYDSTTVPSMSLRLLSLGEFFVEEVPRFQVTVDATSACSHWYYHVFAYLYKTAPYKGDTDWWMQPEQQRLHTRLLSWGRNLLRRIDEFTYQPFAPGPERNVEFCSLLMNRAQVRGLMPLVEWMPHRYTREQIFDSYEAMQRRNVEDWEDIIQHLGSPDNVPDLSIDFNGFLVMVYGAMFQAYDPETRRRAREIVGFFKGKHAQLFHATTMLQIFDENDIGNHDWLLPVLDVYLQEPVGPSINDNNSGNEVDLSGFICSKSNSLLISSQLGTPREISRRGHPRERTTNLELSNG
ncbi:hypothetical protein TruAng_003111 [Truncatella angustata]|nr:hypothetical protein TruAng_003111 [Truncatella angustata]